MQKKVKIVKPTPRKKAAGKDKTIINPSDSDRAQIEDTVHAINESENESGLFRDLFNLCRDGITIADSKTGLIYLCNKAMHQMLGYADGELYNLNISCIHPEEDLPYVLEQFQKFGQEERLMALDIPMKKKDGSVFSADIASTHLMMHGRKCLMGNFRDITERKQADEALRKSEAQYRLLAEHTNDIVWLMDIDTKIIYQSPSSEILRGFTFQELKDLPLEKNLTPESLKLAMELLFSEIPKVEADPSYNPVLVLELEYYRKDGTTVWLENKFSVIRDESGKPVCIMGEGRDITERRQAENALKESEERFRALYERSLHAVYIHDLEGNFIDANQYALDMLGYSRKEIKAINFGTLLSPDQISLAIETAMELIEGGKQSKITEYILKGKDGKSVHIETTATILYREGGPYAILGIALDVTKRKEIEAELIVSERKYRLLADNVTDVIWMSDMNLNTTYISPSVYAMQGHTPEEAMKLSYEQRFTPDSLAKLSTIFAEVMEKEKNGIKLPDNIGIFEAEYYRKDGSTYWTETRASFIRDETEKAVAIMGVTRDISLKKQMEQMLLKLATHDALTGLPNRRLLFDRFAIAMASAQRYNKKFAIMSIDLDKFKIINDTRGHDFGDKILIAASSRLGNSLRKSDTLVRIGGDEFVILLVDIDNEDIATKVAEKLLGDFRQPFIIDESSLNLTISIGISFFPDDGEDLDELLKVSDKSLYIAKESGRNRFAI